MGPGPEMRLVFTPRQRVSRAAGRVDHDPVGEPPRALLREAERLEQLGKGFLECSDGRVAPADDLVELDLAPRATRHESGVPNVERLERTAEPLRDPLRQRG